MSVCVGVPSTSRGTWTAMKYAGRFYPLDPRPEEIDARDIAHNLSNLCRFNGASDEFYSIAQHSVLCADMALGKYGSRRLARLMLLHDAHEAYIGDVSRPLKSVLKSYESIEAAAWCAVAKRFGLPEILPRELSEIDDEMLALEKAALLPDSQAWPGVPEIEDDGMLVWTPAVARRYFWAHFVTLFPEDPMASSLL